MGVQALATMLDLFVEGAPAEVRGPKGTQVIWINKLSAFEKEDVDRYGRTARAKAILAWDRDEDAQAVYDLESGEYSDEVMARALLGTMASTHYNEALGELQSEEAWKEKREYLEQAQTLLGDRGDDVSDEDRQMFESISEEYFTEIATRQQALQEQARLDLIADGREELEKKYRTAYRNAEGMRAFHEERRVAEMYFMTRACKAKSLDDNHRACNNHVVRLLGHRSEVRSLPEHVLAVIAQTIDAITITVAQAGNSVAPTASSESSEQPSEAEDSTASTPTETSSEPAGT